MNNEFIILEDQLRNGETGELTMGIRIMINENFKPVLDNIKVRIGESPSYSQLLGTIITDGISDIILDLKKIP